jgi:hypothetical protein
MRALLLSCLVFAPVALAAPQAKGKPAVKDAGAIVLGQAFHVVSAMVKPSVTGAGDRLVKLYNKKIDCDKGFLEDEQGLLMVLANVRWEAGHAYVAPNSGGTNDSLYFWDEQDSTPIVYAATGGVTVLKAASKLGEVGRVRIGGDGPDAGNHLPVLEIDVTVCDA